MALAYGCTLISDGHKCQRRLHEGSFVWPKATDPCFSVTFEQWQWLIAGVNWQRLSAVLPADFQV